jgi:alkyl hydroperoxide reductase subunit D
MQFEQLLDQIPDYAKDLRVNLGNMLQQQELTPQQAWGTAVCCALAARNPQLTAALESEAAKHMGEQAITAAKSAAAIMGMNNIFYRFRHLSGNDKFASMPARLRMQVIRTHGSDPIDFELWCLAASAVNGCGICVQAHENVLREKGVSDETVLAAVRIASVIHAVATVLDAALVAQPVTA